jgi:peptidoglycan/xylan/chitin deacetylase (PgdA/CDA1 family)
VTQRSINLTFHGVGQTGRSLEPAEQQVWVRSDVFETVLDAVRGREDVRITFDDGNDSDLSHGLPALLRRDMRATFFVVAGRLETPGFLDVAGVQALADAGMTIGCHGMRHRSWRGLDRQALDEELVAARRRLEDIVQRPVTEAACPFGAYDRRVLGALRRAGYTHVYTSDRGSARRDGWLQARNTVLHAADAGIMGEIQALDGSPARTLKRRARQVAKRWR